MNFKYETKGTNTYVVYEIGSSEMIDSMTLGMLTNNKIPGLAQTFFFQQDNSKYVKYNVSSKVSTEQFLTGTVNRKRLIGVFKGIINAMISAEEYMIDTSSLCLDLDYIYTDVTTCETVVLCIPIIDAEKEQVDLKEFFKNIVFSTQFDQTENCDYVAKLFNNLNSASVFSLTDFKDLLDNIERDSQSVPVSQVVPTPAPVSQPTPVSTPVAVISQVVSAPVTPQVPKAQQMPVSQSAKQEKTLPSMDFAIPNQKAENVQLANDVIAGNQSVSNEKEMSLMYLMRNYTKENAAIYKAQQEAKKAAKASASPEKKDKKGKKNKKEKKGKATSTVAMSQAFAIPGQPTEASQPMAANSVTMPTPAPVQVAPQSTLVASQPVVYTAPQPTPVAPIPQPAPIAQPAGRPANFGETTVLLSAGIGETTVLGAAPIMQDVKPYLIRSKNNEKIILDKPVFRIGKEKSYVDYFIGDNTAISRSHANIVQRDGEYFVVDTNSTNHTYVNGGMLQSNVETKISHGAKIRLANEDFEFKIY